MNNNLVYGSRRISPEPKKGRIGKGRIRLYLDKIRETLVSQLMNQDALLQWEKENV